MYFCFQSNLLQDNKSLALIAGYVEIFDQIEEI